MHADFFSLPNAKRKKTLEEEEEAPSTMSLLSLPTHLLHEVISLLPLEAISSCKLVCKQLLNLVSDPEFADLQLYRSRPHLLYRYSDTLSLFNLHSDEAAVRLRANTLWSGYDDRLISSCKGLLCSWKHVSGGRDIVTVCNPILREIITLPELRNCFEISQLAIGFAANKHYKVLCVVCHDKRHLKIGSLDPSYDYEAQMYDIGGASATWRSIGPAPFNLCQPNINAVKSVDTFVNGAVHWFIMVPGESPLIHAFDFDSEKFRVIPPPEKMDINLHRGMQVGILKERLVVSGLNRYRRDQADVWVMKEYGVTQSWTKLYSVVDNNFRAFNPPERILRPVKTLAGTEALVISEVCFVSYDTKSMPSHILETFPELHWRKPDVRAVVLTPSFVSLKRIVNQENVVNLM